ncbi:mannitol dehydrogenase family protein [Alteromonas sp. KUL106]|uniref:mannitol dehydrogenase family protein n=1 Tax=Alteromonas sp. KUL106 TaxID=2480799 RepID=UPI0012E4BE09|nr:mannitol dehydrogenase family protein [Alteromonas sp. KUL106]GFD67800.1 mannitol 2-dehydrogenase [Alteromonas sp. KUL106]
MTKPLSIATLPLLSESVSKPNYDLNATGCGIVHIGPGAFHRAHQAYYTEKALAYGGDWRIHGVSMRSASLKDALGPQDNLYALCIVDNEPETHIIGAIKTLSTLANDREDIVAALVNKQTKIVTLTVTEKGYCLNAQGHLDTDHPDIKADLVTPETPVSAVGLIVQALAQRKQAGYADITIISCDNVSDNGKKLQKAVSEFANKTDESLGQWISENIAFPCTMVDSITPATEDSFKANVATELGLTDNWPIQRESFTQWVVEDNFSGPRPAWDKVGVTFTHNVSFFEKAKLRILNGTHSTLAYIGLLLGKETVYEAMRTPAIKQLIQTMLKEEIVPSLVNDDTEGNNDFDLNVYAQDIVKRYENRHIRHLLSQIAWDGSQKIPFRILDTVRDNLKAKRNIDLLCTAVAAWCLFVNNKARLDETITDPLDEALRATAKSVNFQPDALTKKLLSLDTMFAELSVNNTFKEKVREKVELLLNILSQINNDNSEQESVPNRLMENSLDPLKGTV